MGEEGLFFLLVAVASVEQAEENCEDEDDGKDDCYYYEDCAS